MTIPNRAIFRAAEVCELAQVQPYVLRSWEAEFPDLGYAKTPSTPRVYRRADVERVLRIKQLILQEGLTLAGARRRLTDEGLVATPSELIDEGEVAAVLRADVRERLDEVRRGLQWMLRVLSGAPGAADHFELKPLPATAASAGAASAARASGAAAAASGRSHRTASAPRAAKKAVPSKSKKR